MRHFFLIILWVAVGMWASLFGQVKATLLPVDTMVHAGEDFMVAVKLEHKEGWHTYYKEPGTGLPTTIEWTLPEGWSAGEIQWPTPKVVRDSSGNITGKGYEGMVYLSVALKVPPAWKEADIASLRAEVSWLMCKDVCIPDSVGLTLDIPLSEAMKQGRVDPMQLNKGVMGDAVSTASASIAGILGMAFLGGLILNLMPCVFPVLGIKVLGFVNQAGGDRREVARHGLLFTAGVILSFWVLVAVLLLVRSGGAETGWGFQLQSPVFVYVLAIVLLAFGLNLSGVFDVGLMLTGAGAGLQAKQGYAGSFFTGMLTTVVATPCSAPFLAGALGAAFTLGRLEMFLVFTIIALGVSTPVLLLSFFPALIKKLPRPGPWMETFKQALAFLLYASFGFLVWVLAGQLSADAMLSGLLGFTVIALGLWIYGRVNKTAKSTIGRRAGIVAAFLVFFAGTWLGWPAKQAGHGADEDSVRWEPWSLERVEGLVQEGRYIYVDFTARWCATCIANKRLVFSSSEVRKLIREKNVVLLQADWTSFDQAIGEELARWDRRAVPLTLIYTPGKTVPKIMPEILTPQMVLDALSDTE